jgi:hypothetical protein
MVVVACQPLLLHALLLLLLLRRLPGCWRWARVGSGCCRLRLSANVCHWATGTVTVIAFFHCICSILFVAIDK